MWFVLFGLGAAFVPRIPLPGRIAALPHPPPVEARLALYFLVFALVRLAIRNARVRVLERRARKAAARARDGRFAVAPPGLIEMGAGVGKGVAEAVMGNFLGAAVAGAALMLRLVASRRDDPVALARGAAQKRRAAVLEHRRTLFCILGVGTVCVALAWWPLLRTQLPARLPSSMLSPSLLARFARLR
ncbi:MAG TPA: hypothetical protein VF904_11355 [Anaeromyxobacteraceae bacterium]